MKKRKDNIENSLEMSFVNGERRDGSPVKKTKK